jgi:hypothetical protein
MAARGSGLVRVTRPSGEVTKVEALTGRISKARQSRAIRSGCIDIAGRVWLPDDP